MIKIKNVTKKYGDTIILNQCNYESPTEGIVCLLGASGGGKTTLLNLLAGFDTEYSGEILVGGTPINSLDADALCSYRKNNIGFVFQNYHLLQGYTALENVLLAIGLSTKVTGSDMEKAKEMLRKLGLAEKADQRIETLSGGEKQRVAIARALINDPQIIFADEPTGALDRKSSTEIMELLKEIAKDKLVVIITHDKKICGSADETIHIKDRSIVIGLSVPRDKTLEKKLLTGSSVRTPAFSRAIKNFKVHIKGYIAVSFAISIGMIAFLFSLSFGNVMGQSIEAFKAKNTAFNNGYIKGADNGDIYSLLTEDRRIEHIYYQYKLEDVSLSYMGTTQVMDEKFPMPKAKESLSYGIMPRRERNEIALTPSLAKKFDSDIKSLIGKKLHLIVGGIEYTVNISGVYNGGYDDFFVSSDMEEKFYKDLPEQENYSISYDVKEFLDIVPVSNGLELRGIVTKNAVDEVYALENTFQRLRKLFVVISVLVLGIGLFICTVILTKLQNTRYHELGLLSALGFTRKEVTAMILWENQLLSALATVVNLILLLGGSVVCRLINFPLVVKSFQVSLFVTVTFVIVLLLSRATSYKLVHMEPARALRG